MSLDSSGRSLARGVFLGYAGVLLVLTHWPRLRLDAAPMARPDLVAHAGAFGLWTLLCARAGWFGVRGSARNLTWTGVVALAYASVDEATQAIPGLDRFARWDDFAANVMGIGGGLGAALLVSALESDDGDGSHDGRR